MTFFILTHFQVSIDVTSNLFQVYRAKLGNYRGCIDQNVITGTTPCSFHCFNSSDVISGWLTVSDIFSRVMTMKRIFCYIPNYNSLTVVWKIQIKLEAHIWIHDILLFYIGYFWDPHQFHMMITLILRQYFPGLLKNMTTLILRQYFPGLLKKTFLYERYM